MARELKSFDVTNAPELRRLIEEVCAQGEACVLIQADEQLAILSPVKARPKRSARPRKTGILTRKDSLWSIIGIAGDPDDPTTDVSSNKHQYLAEAHAAEVK